jgi:hypothetical protein
VKTISVLRSDSKFYSSWSLALIFFMTVFLLVHLLGLNTLEVVLGNHYQILDIPVLLADPFKSLLHDPFQPPLLNFWIWLMSVAPGSLYENMVITNCILIAIIAVILFRITSVYLKSKLGAFLLSLFYVVSPPILLNAAYPFYVIAASLGYACLVYSFFVLNERPKYSLGLFLFSLIYLYFLRSSFSLPAALVLSCVYIYFARKNFTKIRLSLFFAMGLSVMLALPIKNYFLYGFFGTTSGYTINLVMAFNIKTPLGPFPHGDLIKSTYPDIKCKYSYVPADTLPGKANGEPNMNSCYYFEYGKAQMQRVIDGYSIKTHLHNIGRNIAAYFDTSEGYHFLFNREQIKTYTFAVNVLFLTLFFKFHQTRLLCVGLFFFLCAKVYRGRQYFPSILLLIFMLHFFAHVLTDGAESRRHVVEVEFIFYIIMAFAIDGIRQRYFPQKNIVS